MSSTAPEVTKRGHVAYGSCGRYTMQSSPRPGVHPTIFFDGFACDADTAVRRHDLIFRNEFEFGRPHVWTTPDLSRSMYYCGWTSYGWGSIEAVVCHLRSTFQQRPALIDAGQDEWNDWILIHINR